MVVVPVIVSLVWIFVVRARSGGQATPFAPATPVGWLAVAATALVIAVAVADASLTVTLPVGFVMFGLASFARWVRHDPGLLIVVPLVFGLTILILPIAFE